jgi:exopolysaccharide biosynthesis polyprenyl glycosylphosphotransferase
MAVGLLVACVLVGSWRFGFFEAFARIPNRRILICGGGALAYAVAQKLQRHARDGYQIMGVVAPEVWSALGEGNTAVLAESALSDPSLDVVALNALEPLTEETREALVHCVERGVELIPLLSIYEQLTLRVPAPYLNDTWFAEVGERNRRRPYVLSKRLLDLTVAVAGLMVTVVIFPFVALAIRLAGGPGPMLYSQWRTGLLGRPFKMYKFRTMAQDAEKDGVRWAAPNDARVTPVGRFLRRTRLDELPQFWNVVKGEMSVVGPRPERPEFVSLLAERIPHYDYRHAVLPGVTGWAQVMFPYGASVEDTTEKLEFDLFYIKNRSFYLDLKIMIKTIGVMAKKIGSR